MPDGRPGRGKETLGVLDALHGVELRRCRGGEVRGQAVDLLDIENRVAFEERNIALGFLAALLVGLGAREGRGIDDKAAALALADASAKLQAPA